MTVIFGNDSHHDHHNFLVVSNTAVISESIWVRSVGSSPWMAAVTQVCKWLSRIMVLILSRAAWTAWTWRIMSMQYTSSLTMPSMPLRCPFALLMRLVICFLVDSSIFDTPPRGVGING